MGGCDMPRDRTAYRKIYNAKNRDAIKAWNTAYYIANRETIKGHIDHITPLKLGGSNWPRNLQLLCASCNIIKNAKDPIAHMQSLGFLI